MDDLNPTSSAIASMSAWVAGMRQTGMSTLCFYAVRPNAFSQYPDEPTGSTIELFQHCKPVGRSTASRVQIAPLP